MSAISTCRWCGALHDSNCPRVRSIEYAEDGITVKRVEFHLPEARRIVDPFRGDKPTILD